jgi:hypothetical protein
MAMHKVSRFVPVCLSLCLVATSFAASKQPVKTLKHDPGIRAVDLFDAIEEGTVETTVIAKSANEASLFVTNKSDADVSIQLPKAVVAVQVLKQFLPQGARNAGPGGGFPGGNAGNGGMSQPIGGGMQNGNFGNQQGQGLNAIGNFNGQGNIPGNGFFSVPSQKTVQVPLKTLCLAHGRPEPRPRMKYRLVKLEDYTNDAALQEMLKLYAAGEADMQTAQAAVWHLTDKMGWDDLRAKQIDRLGGVEPLSYFLQKEVDGAEALIEKVRQQTKDQARRTETAVK